MVADSARRPAPLPFVLVVLVATVVSFASVAHGWGAPGYDLSALVVGARVVRSFGWGLLYDHDPTAFNLAGPAFAAAAREVGFPFVATPFVHPPLLAFWAEPLASLPFVEVMRGWSLASGAALFLLLLLLAWPGLLVANLRTRDAGVLAAIALLYGLLCEPLRYAFWLGQTTLFIVLLIAVAYRFAASRPVLSGLSLALAVFIKLTPAVFLVPWLVSRRGRPIAAFAAGLGLLVLWSLLAAGLPANLAYLSRLREISGTTLVAFNNHSLSALALRPTLPHEELFRWTSFPTPPWAHALVVVAAGGLAASAFVTVRHLGEVQREEALWGILALVILLFPAIVWTHYSVLLLVPASIAWRLCETDPRRNAFRGALVGALLLLVRPVLMDQEVLSEPRGLVVGPPFAALVTLVVLLWVLLRQSAEAGPQASATARSSRVSGLD